MKVMCLYKMHDDEQVCGQNQGASEMKGWGLFLKDGKESAKMGLPSLPLFVIGHSLSLSLHTHSLLSLSLTPSFYFVYLFISYTLTVSFFILRLRERQLSHIHTCESI